MSKLNVRILKLGLMTAALFIVAILLKPNPGAKALSFVGSGRIIDSEFRSAGTSSIYWARIACDPEEVRQYIGMSRLPTNSSTLPLIQNRFSNRLINLPPNYGEYSTDWKEFEVGIGRYVIVAFNDRSANEVLYMTWSH